jgi:hypothetical protein
MVRSQSDSLILDIKVHKKIIKSSSIENLQLRSVMHYSNFFFKGLQKKFAKDFELESTWKNTNMQNNENCDLGTSRLLSGNLGNSCHFNLVPTSIYRIY